VSSPVSSTSALMITTQLFFALPFSRLNSTLPNRSCSFIDSLDTDGTDSTEITIPLAAAHCCSADSAENTNPLLQFVDHSLSTAVVSFRGRCLATSVCHNIIPESGRNEQNSVGRDFNPGPPEILITMLTARQ
jgi:hypothetical protein